MELSRTGVMPLLREVYAKLIVHCGQIPWIGNVWLFRKKIRIKRIYLMWFYFCWKDFPERGYLGTRVDWLRHGVMGKIWQLQFNWCNTLLFLFSFIPRQIGCKPYTLICKQWIGYVLQCTSTLKMKRWSEWVGSGWGSIIFTKQSLFFILL